MSAPRQVLGGITAALVMVFTFASREASASPGAQWYVETVGDECASQRNAFEREITLACDAVGGTCRVASTRKEAELRAVIDCSNLEDSWTLVTRTIDGIVLASLDLSGPRADRLRQAAVEVARDVAPERSLAAESLRFSFAKDAPVQPQRAADKVSLILGGRASASSDATAPALFGLHLLGGLGIVKHASVTLGLAGDAGGSGRSARRAFRGGAGMVLGAPFDASAPIGLALEGGVSSTSRYSAAGSGEGLLLTHTDTAGYAQGTLLVQWPRLTVRPFAALSASVFTAGASVTASAEAGLAFAIF
jgi:hypothetical protein